MTVWFDVESRNGSLMIITTGVIFEGEEPASIVDGNELYAGPKVTKRVKRTKVSRSNGATLVATLRSDYVPGSHWENQSISLKDEGNERSLSNLLEFLVSAKHVELPGKYVVINATKFDLSDLDSLLESLFDNTERLKLLPLAMKIAEHREIAAQLEEFVSKYPGQSQIIADGMNLARRENELREFRELVEQECGESEYQRFLMENPWIFGSEYNRMYHRYIVKGKEFDFPMQRTADGYLEIVEIKRPDHSLFTCKKNKNTGEKEIVGIAPVVARAIYQVDGYLSQVEKQVNHIQVEENISAEKVRGKVIIGNTKDHESKIRAVRQLNARMNKIEVITYDQLIANAQRMLEIMRKQQDVRNSDDGLEEEDLSLTPDDSDETNTKGKYPFTPSSVDDIPF